MKSASRVLLATMLLAAVACEDRTPEVGTLEPVVVPPAEALEVHSLGNGETLGEVLEANLDFQEQQALLMAFREQASPRRMRVGTEITLRYLNDGPLRGV